MSKHADVSANRLNGLARVLILVPTMLAASALFALMLLTFSDVMLRSVFNAPIQSAADLTRVLMAVSVFSVLPILSARGGHIRVDLLDELFSKFGLARVLDAAISLACGLLLIWPMQRIWILAERSRSYGDVMEYLGWPTFWVGWFISVMVGVTAVALILRGLAQMFAPKFLDTQGD